MTPILIILVILLFVALFSGSVVTRRHGPRYGWSPLGIAVILLVLYVVLRAANLITF